MIQRILGAQISRVASAAFLIGGFSVLSKIIGLYRNRIFTGEFGIGSTLDVYYSAFLIPDFIYNLFVLGLLSAVFIPIFSEYLHKDEKEAWHFANVSFNMIFIVMGIFSVLAYILMPYVLPIIVHGFSDEMKSEAIGVARLMLLSPVLLSLSSVMGSIAQNFNKYIFYALAPVFYNLGIIFGAFVFGPSLGAYGLAIGVAIGSFLHFLIQAIGASSAGFRYMKIFDFRHIGLIKMGKLSILRFLSIVASQVNLIILTSMASFLAVGSITVFNLANDLQFIPIGIIALSYAVAVFPKFSNAIARDDKDSFAEELFMSIKQVLFFVLPISIIFFFASFQVVVLLYGIDTFGVGSSQLVAGALSLFSLSIFAQSLSPILTRAFFAMQNTIVPFVSNVISIFVMVALGLFFVFGMQDRGALLGLVGGVFGVGGVDLDRLDILILPIAFSVGAILNFGILLFMVKKVSPSLDFSVIKKDILKLILASVSMALTICAVLRLNVFQDGIYYHALGDFLLAVCAGGGVYILALWILKSEELIFFKEMMIGVFKKSIKGKTNLEYIVLVE